MARALVLSNGQLCVTLDEAGRVRDVYFPHVGLEDHVRSPHMHRIGVWADGSLAWLGDEGWELRVESEEHALASRITAKHARLEVELLFTDLVYNEKNIFVRSITVTNATDRSRDIRLFFAHEFEIYKSPLRDTAYYDPLSRSVVHYKGRRVFLASASLDGELFQDYTTGVSGFQDKEGSFRDAEDGALSKNPIEHGPTDSVIGLYGHYEPRQTRAAAYWLVAAETIDHAQELNSYVLERSPAHLVRTTTDFWRAWVDAYDWHLQGLTPEHAALFRRSLMIVRAHVDRGGGIVASLDSDMLQYGKDNYTYVWPRDGAYIALALDAAGDANVAKRFFQFAAATVTAEGYMMHKYLPDHSLGSSWHPWIRDGVPALPIQEDETALPIYALGEHYRHSRDVEFLETMYGPVVKRGAQFMLDHRDPHTKLPLPSYDLWEEKWGTHTFTCASVYGALKTASQLAGVLGKRDDEARFLEGANEVRDAILTHLWDEERGYFIKHALKGEHIQRDTTLDISSVYGIFQFGVLPATDSRVARAFEASVRTLSFGNHIGGLARYENDGYYRASSDSTGNPWIITTLWYAEYLIARAKTDHDLDHVREIFSWVAKRALPSGALAEQFDPKTGAPLSALPLTWSHSTYVYTIVKYLDKLEELGLCKECNPAP
jgi:GH15 family glucan-1,4-alpha-glucosidase